MGSFGTTEIILIVAVLFLLFGASRLPQLAKSFGQTRKAFKDGMKEAEEEERLENEQKRLNPNMVNPSMAAPPVKSMTDEDLSAEMRRRVEAKQQ